jgi:hypothetical protein
MPLTPLRTFVFPQENLSFPQEFLGTAMLFKRSKVDAQLPDQLGNHYCLCLCVGIPFCSGKAYLNLSDQFLYGIIAGSSIEKHLAGLLEKLTARLS